MEHLIAFLKNRGPVSGKDLVLETGIDIFTAWKACNTTEQIVIRIVGTRYLRLDLKVEGFARLSPSVMREFLNYTIVGLESQNNIIAAKAEQIEKGLAAISKRKIGLAYDTMVRLVKSHPDRVAIMGKTCFLIAGDVVFGMAHAEPRPESSTGELVRGSDLDIIVITADLPDHLFQSLDNTIYKEKYNLLKNPALKEEIDYIIKDLGTVENQLQFTDFKAMVASKILNEGQYLLGSQNLYNQVKEMLVSHGIPEKISLLENKAQLNRTEAESCLISACDTADHDQLMALFYTTEEKEEIF